jgi:hypothetical protein
MFEFNIRVFRQRPTAHHAAESFWQTIIEPQTNPPVTRIRSW